MSQKGYTLVELLTVLTILALLTAVSSLYLGRHSKHFALRVAVFDLASCLRLTRARAIAKHKENAATIDLDQRSYVCLEKLSFFPPESRLLFRTAASEYVRDKTARLRFFADGSATGGHVFMEEHGQIWAVRVNWLSGSVEATRETNWPEQ